MPFNYEIYKTQRVCPVRFKRHGTGKPVLDHPDIDDRGYFRANANGTGFDRGPVIAVPATNLIEAVSEIDTRVKVVRERIDNRADLYATSSDEAVMTVTPEMLPNTKEATLKIFGIKGKNSTFPQGAKLEIRYGSKNGVIIGELSVWVFSRLNVLLTPHRMTIQAENTGFAITSAVDVEAVINIAKAVWRPLGVIITSAPVQKETIRLKTAGVLEWHKDFEKLLKTYFVPDTINAYFVNQINVSGFTGVLGYGLSRKNVEGTSMPYPGIFLGDRNQNGRQRQADIHWLGNDLAHEIGHFFGIPHVDLRDIDNARDDSWARRMLMHPANTRNGPGTWRDDVGYGNNYRGALVTLKDLLDSNNAAANHITDPEYLTARTTIKSAAGPY